MAAVDTTTARPTSRCSRPDVPVESYGFVELDGDRVTRIVETKDAGEVDRTAPRQINAGQYAARASWLWSQLPTIAPAPNGERYLTPLASMAHDEGNAAVAVEAADPVEVRGINDRIQLAEAEAAMRDRIRRRHMLAGVTIVDPAVDVHRRRRHASAPTRRSSRTRTCAARRAIGANCTIGPGTLIRDSTIGDALRDPLLDDRRVDAGGRRRYRARTATCGPARTSARACTSATTPR